MMTIRGTLVLVASLTALSLSVTACTGSSDDDDDDGFSTPTLTATPTGTGTPVPTPTPGPAIQEQVSFVAGGGTELWLCFDTQFEGNVVNVRTTDGGTCDVAVPGLGLPAVADKVTKNLLMITGLTGCGAGSHDWFFDYEVTNDPRCPTGCVNKTYEFSLDADGAFGGLCSPGVVPITALSAYLSPTTAEHRFTAVASGAFSIVIQKIRVYEPGGATFRTECTAAASITSNGTGLFDTSCTPTFALVEGNDYSAIVSGTVEGGRPWAAGIDFSYVAPPAP